MAAISAARNTGYCASGVLVPMRSAQTGKSGHEVNVATVRDAVGESLDFTRGIDDAEAITEPLDNSAADENASFKGKVGFRSGFPWDCGEQLMARRGWF